MSEAIVDAVRSRYGAVAKSGLSTGHDGVKAVIEAFGYAASVRVFAVKPMTGDGV